MEGSDKNSVESSRQWRWQKKKHSQGKCIVCGKKKNYKSWRCKKCYKDFRVRNTEYARNNRIFKQLKEVT